MFCQAPGHFRRNNRDVPEQIGLEKKRKSREFLNGLDDAEQAFSSGPLSASSEHQLLSGILEGHHIETPLYASEGT